MTQVLRCVLVLVSVAAGLRAPSPVKHTYAYSRGTIPAIPAGGSAGGSVANPFPTSYFIYVVVEKDVAISVIGVWLHGKYLGATLRKVNSPVLVDRDVAVPTGERDTLVGKTTDDVYQVELTSAKSPGARDEPGGRLAQRNDVVVVVKAHQSTWYAAARIIVTLRPTAAM